MGLLKKIKTAVTITKEEGIYVTWYKFKAKFGIGLAGENAAYLVDDEKRYQSWMKKNETDLNIKNEEEIPYKPLISVVVPVYNVSMKMLKECIMSVVNQTYDNWELCLADDASTMPEVKKCLKSFENNPKIKIKYRDKNGHISRSTNSAIEMATGEYVAFMDCDDVLAVNALYEVVKLLNKDKTIDFIYSDEDKLSEDGKHRHQPHFKPDWSPDTMMSLMYTCHLGVYRKKIGDEIGWLRTGFEGAQDYDFILRCAEQAGAIGHIPRILYHWRCHKESTSENPFSKQYAVDAGKRAIGEHLKRLGVDAVVTPTKDMGFYEVEYPLTEQPLVSIIIPSKDEVETLRKCIAAVEKSSYGNYEVIVVENNSCEDTFRYYGDIAPQETTVDGTRCMEGKLAGGQRICVAVYTEGFNYSKLNNFGVKFAKGSYYLLMNNDIEMIGNDWMKRMLGSCLREEVGIVGAKLFYPDHTIQHAGIVVGIGGSARGIGDNMFVGLAGDRSGYMHKASLQLDYSAVTAACLMVKREIYEQAGVFEEIGGLSEAYQVAYNDVDFCLKVRRLGKLVVYEPHVQAYHYESKSRGAEDSPEKTARFQREIEYMRNHWIGILKNGDPYYNPNLTLKSQSKFFFGL